MSRDFAYLRTRLVRGGLALLVVDPAALSSELSSTSRPAREAARLVLEKRKPVKNKNTQAPIVDTDVPSSFELPCKKVANGPNLVSSKLSKMMLELVAKKWPIMLTSESFFPEAPAFNSVLWL